MAAAVASATCVPLPSPACCRATACRVISAPPGSPRPSVTARAASRTLCRVVSLPPCRSIPALLRASRMQPGSSRAIPIPPSTLPLVAFMSSRVTCIRDGASTRTRTSSENDVQGKTSSMAISGSSRWMIRYFRESIDSDRWILNIRARSVPAGMMRASVISRRDSILWLRSILPMGISARMRSCLNSGASLLSGVQETAYMRTSPVTLSFNSTTR